MDGGVAELHDASQLFSFALWDGRGGHSLAVAGQTVHDLAPVNLESRTAFPVFPHFQLYMRLGVLSVFRSLRAARCAVHDRASGGEKRTVTT